MQWPYDGSLSHIGLTIICHTRETSFVIIAFHSCMVTACMCICTGGSKNLQSSTVPVHRESSRMWPNSLLMKGVYCLQYKCPAMPLTMVVYAMYLCDVLNLLAGPQLHVT